MKNIAASTLLLSSMITHLSFAIDQIAIDPEATIHDSPTTLMGVNHIGLSVKDLDATLAFYQRVTGFELVHRKSISNSEAADTLYGIDNVEYEIAVLEAPNMLFEFIEFKHNANKALEVMPVYGPGMTHTCFQSAVGDSVYDRFRDAGATILSRGDDAVDLGGYGVYYAYAYDPEGNMFEMELLDPGPLATVERKVQWIDEGHRSWMTQVALVTHDINRLTNWYAKIMEFSPYRVGEYADHPRMIEVADADNLSLMASWFRMDDRAKTLEFWQYQNPVTPTFMGKRGVTDFGYSYSIEVGDIQAEYSRMKNLGVEFVSEPVLLNDYWQVYANDIDGNVFALRQWVDPNSPYSVPNLEL
ncbi:MAG: VOC family protein [Pseudomonadales bacterium]|nr:VOC family protein [Pseudomonadales bacterium]